MRVSHVVYARGRAALTIDVARDVARQRGGTCLSQTYVRNDSPLVWRCELGHVWASSLANVKNKSSWCPHCSGTVRLSIAEAEDVALARGGRCLSSKYRGSQAPLQWQCAQGHEWWASLHSLKNKKTWCPICARHARRLNIDVARLTAQARNGQCLSRTYNNVNEPLRWMCSEGHEWTAALRSVKGKGSWCPHCAGTARLSIRIAADLAASHGGVCLSTNYVNRLAPLQWRCAEGHEWTAALAKMRSRSTWCPTCATQSKRVAACDALAEARGGKCLSGLSELFDHKLRWQCKYGHTWSANFYSVKSNGTWCPECAGNARLNIGVAKDIAAAHGGACLSSTYLNTNSHLRWRCKLGHVWMATLSSVRTAGSWCPHCAKGSSEEEVRRIFETIFCGSRFPNCRPRFLRGSSRSLLELDGYCASLAIAFEYNGEQHYNSRHFFHSRDEANSYDAQRRRDHEKSQICNSIGIRLVVVPHFVQDRWTHIRTCLLRWFSVASLYRPGLCP